MRNLSVHNFHSVLFSTVLLIFCFSNCNHALPDIIGNRFCQEVKNRIGWQCISKQFCWYYAKQYDKELLYDGTNVEYCSGAKMKICCPPTGNQFCREVKNLTGSECTLRRNCWHYNTTESHVTLPGYKTFTPCSVTKMCCSPPPKLIEKKEFEGFEEASHIVQEKCKKYNEERYTKISCNHSTLSNTDVKLSTAKEFPHMALIGYMKRNEVEWKCSGSLISEKFILSAAHCTNHKGTPAELVLLGAVNYVLNGQNRNAVPYTIVEKFLHPDYNPEMMNHDIVLFKLNNIVKFNAYIRPICLSTSLSSPSSNQIAIVTGGLRSDTDFKREGAFMKEQVNIFDNKECIVSFQKHPLYPHGINNKTILCGGNTDYEGKYVCKDDDGGPLQTLNKECSWEQHGIVSLGPMDSTDDKNHKRIYTRVSYYIVWIRSIVWSTQE